MLFSCNPYWMEEICDTPAEFLASRDPTDACVEEAQQTVGGKGAISEIKGNFIKKRTAGKRVFFVYV
ncbi:hypothetical protein [Peribacillus frigoritolerans]|uniref:hypothetical protein n=1 Tax=Peribacillus frigoritolerans TaxID=450367 RepID=UPI0039A2A6AB